MLDTTNLIFTGGATALLASWPKPVGYYKFGGNTRLTCTKRPRWLTRFLMKHLIEWEWEDA